MLSTIESLTRLNIIRKRHKLNKRRYQSNLSLYLLLIDVFVEIISNIFRKSLQIDQNLSILKWQRVTSFTFKATPCYFGVLIIVIPNIEVDNTSRLFESNYLPLKK